MINETNQIPPQYIKVLLNKFYPPFNSITMMKNKEIMAELPVPTIEEIMVAGNAYAELVARYVVPFTKKTDGTKSMGDVGFIFAENARKRKDQYPEVASGTFDADEFDVKMDGVTNMNTIKALNKNIDKSMDEALVICKTDALSFANEFYGYLLKVKDRLVKYKTAFDELAPFYSKSKAEKVTSNKANKNSTDGTTDMVVAATAA